MANNLLQWTAYEFEHREKNSAWYATFIVVVLLFIGYELIQKDYFAALTFFIIGLVAFAFARMTPREITVLISDKGINVGNFHVPFVNVKKFWIVDHLHAKALHLETTAYLNRFMVIQLGDTDSDQVRSVLIKHIPEDRPNRESVAQRIARRLHF